MEALFLSSNKPRSDSFVLDLDGKRSTSIDISRQSARNGRSESRGNNFLDSSSKGTSHHSRDNSLAFSSSNEPLLSDYENKADKSSLARARDLIRGASPFRRRYSKKTNKNLIEATPGARYQYQAVTEEKYHAVKATTPSDTASSSERSSNEPSVSSTLESTSLLRKQSSTKKDVVLVEWIKGSDEDHDKLYSSDDTQDAPLLNSSFVKSKSCFCIPRKKKQKGLSKTGSSFRSFKSERSPEQQKYCAYHEEPEHIHSPEEEYNAMGTFEDFNIEPVHWNPVFMEGTKISDLQNQVLLEFDDDVDDDDDDEYEEEEAEDELDNLIGSLDGGIEIMGTPLDSQLSTLYEVDDEERTRSTSTSYRTMDRTASRSQRLLGCWIQDGSLKSLLHDEDITEEHPEEGTYQFTAEDKRSPPGVDEVTTKEESEVPYFTTSKIRSTTPSSLANTGSTASISRLSSQNDTNEVSETCDNSSSPPITPDPTQVAEQVSIAKDELSDFYSLSTSGSDGGEIVLSETQEALSDITEDDTHLPGRQSTQEEQNAGKNRRSIGTNTVTPAKMELQNGFRKYREIQDNKDEDYVDYNNLMYYSADAQRRQKRSPHIHSQRKRASKWNVAKNKGIQGRTETSHSMRVERVAI